MYTYVASFLSSATNKQDNLGDKQVNLSVLYQ